MIDAPQIVQTDAQPTAVIRLTIPRSEIQTLMGPAMGEVMAAIAAQVVAPAGPMFSYHFAMHPDTFDFEVGVPVSAPIKPAGRVYNSQLPAARVARTIYHGPYEGLGAGWAEFSAWIKTAGHVPAKNLWERYLVDPSKSSNPADWQTELNKPLLPPA